MKNNKELKPPLKAPISVIVPFYQAGKTLTRAVKSILEQSLQVSEIILIDDGSTDNSLNIANRLASDHKDLILVISLNSNNGVSEARNAGWEIASYEYIAFLDADDTWHAKKIEIQYNFLLLHPNCLLVGHLHQIESNKTAINLPFQNFKAIKLTKFNMLLFTPFATPTVMLKRKVSIRFNSKMKFAEDYLLWLQIVSSGGDVQKIYAPLATTYKRNYGESGLSRNMVQMEIGVHKAYQVLFRDKMISRITLILLIIYSSAKFCLRFIVSFFYHLLNK